MMKLDSSISTPLYDQLKQKLREAIDHGEYKQGEKLPNEAELCDLYGVSRITVRKAIQELCDEGFLERKQGKGTFVMRKKVKREMVTVDGFTDFVRLLGKKPTKKILVCEEIKASQKLAESLQIEADAPVLRLLRLMYVDGQPFTIDETHYSLDRFPNLATHFLENVSTYDVLKNIYHVNIHAGSTHKVITVDPATSLEAEYLECKTGETLFNIDKIVYDENKVPIHTSHFKTPTAAIALTITT
jgi:GntR family transcriptional regulator, frlABCD operon transcriptional regulator